MVRINRVYTRAGDGGTTHLVGGQTVGKHHVRIEAYGTVDELNAVLGLLREALTGSSDDIDRRLDSALADIQQHLFDLGSELACRPEDLRDTMPLVSDDVVGWLESEIDVLNEPLPTLDSFILPGGGRAGALFHLARTVCRRAERRVVALSDHEAVRSEAVRFLNRLSDYFFVAGRAAARSAGVPETLWDPRRSAR